MVLIIKKKKLFTYLPTQPLEDRVAFGETNIFLRLAPLAHFAKNSAA